MTGLELLMMMFDHTTHHRASSEMYLRAKGITPAGSGDAGQAKNVEWSILGHTYWLKAESEECFIFETLDPPG